MTVNKIFIKEWILNVSVRSLYQVDSVTMCMEHTVFVDHKNPNYGHFRTTKTTKFLKQLEESLS